MKCIKYVKKPIPIEAWKIEYTDWSINGFPQFIQDELMKDNSSLYFIITIDNKEIKATIKTLEGVMTANHGDYIIKGVHGEFYPCKPDIFEESYEEYHEE